MNLWLWAGCMVVALGFAVWSVWFAFRSAMRDVLAEDFTDDETAI